ncbi:hypothetical protein Tco_1116639, partial [Tanacetum coccineum]
KRGINNAIKVMLFDVITLSDLEENGEHEIAKIVRIETDICDFETSLCTTFNDFNCLLKIDADLFTRDIQRAKNYEEYKNELNNDPKEPWSKNGVPYELTDHMKDIDFTHT